MRILAFIGALAIVTGVLFGGYFLGGFYSVAASASDAGPVVWALTRVRTASIARHAGGQPPFALDDATVLRDGARHFAAYGCVHCHGAPGAQWSKFAEGLNPEAADLSEVAKTRDASAIFWVLKNGIRMTGMPSFGKAGIPDNELWQIVAFVKKLPSVSESDYKSWSASSQ
jgi:mono/diheme cytochrome c family protein